MERRRESRLFVELPGSYRQRGSEAYDIIFGQISANGCSLSHVRPNLVTGDTIHLSLGPMAPIGATVRWRSEDKAGVEFDEPLEAFIVEHFAAFCGAA